MINPYSDFSYTLQEMMQEYPGNYLADYFLLLAEIDFADYIGKTLPMLFAGLKRIHSDLREIRYADGEAEVYFGASDIPSVATGFIYESDTRILLEKIENHPDFMPGIKISNGKVSITNLE